MFVIQSLLCFLFLYLNIWKECIAFISSRLLSSHRNCSKEKLTSFRLVFSKDSWSESLIDHFWKLIVKGCVHYIFASLFCKSKSEHSWSKEKCFLFHYECSFHSWDNQILTFQVFKCHDVTKCLNMKHERHFTE